MMTSLAVEAASRPQFWARVNFLGSCWEWTAATTAWGYGRLRYGGHEFAAHRCSYEYATGPIPRGLFVLHHCDNPPCVNPAHLFVGTARDNTLDMLSKGRNGGMGAQGTQNRRARLTDDDVVAIRERFAAGTSSLLLADEFGVTGSNINRILSGRAWAHVGGPLSTRDRRGLHRKRTAA